MAQSQLSTGEARHDGAVTAVAVLPDGRVASARDDRRVRWWMYRAARPQSARMFRVRARYLAVRIQRLPFGGQTK